MAHWSNATLTVVGGRAEVGRFAREARESRTRDWPSLVIRRPRPQDKPRAIFTPAMWMGEGGPLWSERIESIGDGLSQKKYHFQTRNDDGVEHFQEVSRIYPSLHFVLVSHPGVPDECRSFQIQDGRTKSYAMPKKLMNAVLTKHGYDPDLDPDGDEAEENEDKEWEAYWEMMRLAESHWLDGLLSRVRLEARLAVQAARSGKAAPK